jgi:methionyl aminopeptidase
MTKLQAMTEGGKRLGWIKGQLPGLIREGVTPLEIDSFVDKAILSGGDKHSFKTVDHYPFATCINVNAGIVHGLPGSTPFKSGDVVKVDMGLIHQGFHLDTSLTVSVGPPTPAIAQFLAVSQRSLKAAIALASPGNTIYDLGEAMQTVAEAGGYNVIRDLTGHGIGRQLHLEPYIPCYADPRNKKIILAVDQTLAIEAMVSMGDYRLVEDSDGWTLSTQDGSLTAMFEETVYITAQGPQVLTTTN